MRTKLIKVVSLLLMISLLTIATSVVVTADTSAPFILESSEVKDADGNVTAITVEVVCNIATNCFGLNGEFNTPNGLTLDSIDINTTDSNDVVGIPTDASNAPTGIVFWVDINFDNGISTDNAVVTATYKVAGGAAIEPGTYTFTFTPSVYVDGSDDAYVEYTEVLDTTVTVADEPAGLKGDVNLDDVVDLNDLVALAQHIGETGIITDSLALDNAEVTGEGDVDLNDLVKIAQYVGEAIDSLD